MPSPIDGTSGADFLTGTPGDDIINGLAGEDVLRGLGGNDQLRGGDNDDNLDGGPGNDQLYGENGNDYLRGGADDDLIDGGAGFDRAAYFTAAAGVTVDLRIQDGSAQDTLGAGHDILLNIENLSGSIYSDTLYGNDGDNWIWSLGPTDGVTPTNDNLYGFGGNDLLETGTGDHILDGGTGNDTISFGNPGDILYAAPGPGIPTGIVIDLLVQGSPLDTHQGIMTLTSIENVSGSVLDDVLDGDNNANLIAGDAGDDNLLGRGGNDTIYGDGAVLPDVGTAGGSGPIITYTADRGTEVDYYDASGHQVFVYAGQELYDAAGHHLLNGVDYAFLVGNPTGSDGVVGNDVIDGGAGDDMLYGGGGNDLLNGGRGASSGNDLLDGGDGDDYLTGGVGDDIITGGAGIDRAGYFTSTGGVGVNVDLRIVGVAQNTGSQGMDTLSGIENVSGTTFADTLTGDDGDNWLWGSVANFNGVFSSTNNDTILGLGGNDLITVGIGNQLVDGGADNDTLRFTENGGIVEGGITVSLALQGSAQATGYGNWTLSNFENLSGGQGGDHLVGDGGNNRLTGEGGDDTLDGGGGDDVLSGDAVYDADTHGLGYSGAARLIFDPDAVAGNDHLDGGAGDDTGLFLLTPGAGTLTLDHDGPDLLVKRDAETIARISFAGDTVTVQGLNSGAQLGTDTLVDIEHLSFQIDGGGAPLVIDLSGGVVVDGYIAGGIVFADANQNGALDAGEAWTTTDAEGNFVLPGGSGPLVMVGGTNVDTGLPNLVTLTAPEGSAVVNPLTTLVQTLIAAGATPGDAQDAVANAFGIDTNVDLTSFDPLAAGANAADALAVQQASAAVVVLVVAGGDAAGGDPASQHAVFDALAGAVAGAAGAVDLTDSTTVSDILTDALPSTDVSGATSAVNAAAAAIAAATSLDEVADAQTEAFNDPPTVTIHAPTPLPVGGEVEVNSVTAGTQTLPSVAGLADGSFVIVWSDFDRLHNYLQRFDADGTPVGGETQVLASTDFQGEPSIVALTGGGYVISWVGGSGGGAGVYAQIFDAAGAPVGGEIAIGNLGADISSPPAMAALPGGGFAITWQTDNASNTAGAPGEVEAAVYDASGAPVAAAFQVNTTTADWQGDPSIALTGDGGFRIAFSSHSTPSQTDIRSRDFDADGTPRGSERVENDTLSGSQDGSALALAGTTEVVVWHSTGILTGDFQNLYHTASTGSPVHEGTAFALSGRNIVATGLADGTYMLAMDYAGDGRDILAAHYDADGNRIGFVDLTFTHAGDQQLVAIGATPDGFVGAWADAGEIHAQRFVLGFQAIEQLALDLKHAISVGDADADTSVVTATLSVDYGVLHLDAGGSGASIVSGNDSASVTVSGTIDQINALLDSDGASAVNYTPDTDTPPDRATLTVSVDDGGANGAGGPQTGSASVQIDINEVDDLPVISNYDNVVAASGTGPIDLRIAAPTDVDSPSLTILLTAVPSYGVVEYFDGTNWLTATGGETLTADELTSLRYTPPASGEFGGETIAYEVDDDNSFVTGVIGVTAHVVTPDPELLLFAATDDNSHNPDLYAVGADGVLQGAAVNPPGGSFAGEHGGFIQFGGATYFNAVTPATGEALFRMAADGSVAPVDDGNGGYFGNLGGDSHFTIFAGSLYFDGTVGGSGDVAIKLDADGNYTAFDLNPGHQNFAGANGGFVEYDGSLYFSAITAQTQGFNPDLIRLNQDGTHSEISTRAAGSAAFGSNAGEDGGFIVFNDKLYFNAYDDLHGDRLFSYTSDGGGPVEALPNNVTHQIGDDSAFHVFAGSLYFNEFSQTSASNSLFRLDADDSLTELDYLGSPLVGAGQLGGWVDFAGGSFFVASSPTTGMDLFRIDSCGCIEAIDVNLGAADAFDMNLPANFTIFGGALYFDAYDGAGTDGLFRLSADGDLDEIDLGGAGTTLAGVEGGFQQAFGSLFFSAYTSDGYEIVRLEQDGSYSTYDINPGPGGNAIVSGDGQTFGLLNGNPLTGGGGKDIIAGSAATETLSGGGGDDVLESRGGNDHLAGGDGADLLVLSQPGAANLVTLDDYDFYSGDKVDLSALLDAGFGSNSNVSDFVRLFAVDDDIKLQIDADGAANGANWTDVAILPGGNDPFLLDTVEVHFNNADYTLTELFQFNLQTIPLASGGWAVTWTEASYEQGDVYDNVFGRVFDDNGEQIGGTFQISATDNGMDDQNNLIAALPNGDFAVVWQACENEVWTRIYHANGTPATDPIAVQPPDPDVLDVLPSGIVALSNGGYAVLWAQGDLPTDGGENVYISAFGADGTLAHGPVRVDSAGAHDDAPPPNFELAAEAEDVQIVALAHGFAVTWLSERDTGPGGATEDSVFVRVFDNAGNPVSPEIQANSVDGGLSSVDGGSADFHPTLVALGGDDFAVQWESDTDTEQGSIFARIFDDADYTAGAPIRLDASVGPDSNPGTWDAAALVNGGFVSLWAQYDDSAPGAPADIYVQVRDANGALAAGSAPGGLVVNQVAGAFTQPDQVLALAGGGFAILYDSERLDGTGAGIDWDVYVRTYAADGTPTSAELRVNPANVDTDFGLGLTALPNGNFLTFWAAELDTANGLRTDIFARMIGPDGSFLSGAIQIGSTPSDPTSPFDVQALGNFRDAVSANGEVLAAWISADLVHMVNQLTIGRVDRPPLVDLNGAGAGIGDSGSYTEGDAGTGIGSAIAVTLGNVDNMIRGATVAIGDPVTGDQLFVDGTLPAGIAIDLVQSTDLLLVLTGAASAADYTAALSEVRFRNTSDDPAGAGIDTDRSIAITVQDGAYTSVPATMSLSIAAVNDAPVFSGLDATPSFTEGGSPVVLDGNATVADAELTGIDYAGATLTLARSGGAAAEDVFGGTGGAGLTLSGGNASVDGTVIGTFTQSGGTLTISFNASANQALVDQALQGITYSNSSDNPPASVVIAYTLDDGNAGAQGSGGALSGSGAITVSISSVDDPSVANGDSGSTNEDATLKIDVVANDSDPDGPAPAVAKVNGVAISVGSPVTLPSGAIVSLNLDGTLTYDPNGRFNTLTSTASGEIGAVNTSAADSFTYTLGGSPAPAATVNVTVNGVASAQDQLKGDSGDNVITGTPSGDFFDVSQGGNDTVTGLGANDGFFFGAAFTAADHVDGGAGSNDQIGLQGDYTGANALTLGSDTIANVEAIVVLPGFSYDLKMNDGNVAAGQVLKVQATQLTAGQSLHFDGSAEHDGSFIVYGGQGNDVMIGGDGNDGFYFGPGAFTSGDSVNGGPGGNDQLGLDGNYGAFGPAFVLGANITNVEVVVLLPGPSGSPNSFNLTTSDALVPGGQMLTIFGLQVATDIRFDGSHETNGAFRIYGGSGNDIFTGSAGNDWIFGGNGGDLLTGGLGADTFYYDGVGQSTSTGFDRLIGFDDAADKIDLPFAVTGFAGPASGNLSTASFDSDLSGAFAGLTSHQAGMFTATGGDMSGRTFLVVDADGVQGYQAGSDYVIEIVTPATPVDNPAIFI